MGDYPRDGQHPTQIRFPPIPRLLKIADDRTTQTTQVDGGSVVTDFCLAAALMKIGWHHTHSTRTQKRARSTRANNAEAASTKQPTKRGCSPPSSMLVVAPEAQLSKTTLSFQHGRALTLKNLRVVCNAIRLRKKRALVSDFGTLADDFAQRTR